MSAYEYYEFLALERPLTAHDRRELAALATGAEVTATRFCTGYGLGFNGDPHELMARHFDVMVHLTSGGSRELMIRLPRGQVDESCLTLYCCSDSACYDGIGDQIVVNMCSEVDGAEDLDEGDGWMAALAPLREEWLRGDWRGLYLAWLLSVQGGDLSDEAPEPPVPPGLGSLSGPQQELQEFLRIDPDLVAAAAECSPAGAEPGPDLARRWACKLPAAEKDALFARILVAPGAAHALVRRFRHETAPPPAAARRVGDLLAAARRHRDAREAMDLRLRRAASASRAPGG